MFFSRMSIDEQVLSKYFTRMAGDTNPAYTANGVNNVVYMQYQEKGNTYFTILDSADYEKIRLYKWEGFNEYVVLKKDHSVFLHREICPNLQKGQIVHHKSHRFDNRASMLVPVSQQEHDRHRTYHGDVLITIK